MSSGKHTFAKRLGDLTEVVWVEFGRLAVENKAVNLGQGFPDFMPPDYMRKAFQDVCQTSDPLLYQYSRSYGSPRLVKIMGELYSKLMNREIDANNEILITAGATETLFCSINGLVDPGDEVIIIEPFFDSYEPMIKQAGGIPVPIPLRPNKTSGVITSDDWKLDPQELASLFNSKTKAIIVNNPNNPLGKTFTMDELQMIADLCIKHDVIAISDEVYEWLVYKPKQHIRLANVPGMWERTITIGSAGKTFSVTGWKIGWAIGPLSLIKVLCAVHQNSVYNCCTPLQEAIAIGFETEISRINTAESYWETLSAELLTKRNKMAALLAEVDMVPIIPEGGYFMIADISKIKFAEDKSSAELRDYQFVRWMTINKKLTAIPASVFYTPQNKHLAENLVRFCFIKEDSTLDKAAAILQEWKKTW